MGLRRTVIRERVLYRFSISERDSKHSFYYPILNRSAVRHATRLKEQVRGLECMEAMSETNEQRFQDLVYHTKSFSDYFKKATPIKELALMRLGSRPVSRGGTIEIEDVRAIPWIFSWTQNRHLLPGWYPIGYALDSILQGKKS